MITISGIVIKGQQKARLLGFPTANLACELPIKEGIYGGVCDIAHLSLFKLTTLIYYRDKVLEAHLLGQDLDLYDQWLDVHLSHFIRHPAVYENDNQMIKLIEEDIKILHLKKSLTE